MRRGITNIAAAVTAAFTVTVWFLAAGQTTAGGLDRGGVSLDFRTFQNIDTDVPEQSLTVAVLPFSFIDETYCLASGQVGVLHIDGNNTLGRPLINLRLVLTLPEGVRIVSLRNPQHLNPPQIVERDGQNFSQYVIPGTAIGYSGFSGNFILLDTDLAPSEVRYPAECYLADETFQGPTRTFNIQIINPVYGKQPELFETGVHIWNEFTYGDPEALKTLAEQYAGTGFNSIQLGTASSPAMSAAFKTAGLRRYIQTLIVNGYSAYGQTLPEADKYRGVDMEPIAQGSWWIPVCPVAITGKGQYFTETLAPALRKIIVEDDLSDSLMCNWEPYMYENNGCFCQKCKAEFIEYANVPAAEIEAAWPQQVISKYASVWPRFRSWQHARLVLTLEETIADLGREVGKQAHFIPEISNRFKRGNWPYSQYDPRDYMEQLPVIQAWGPYLYHRFSSPYVYTLGRHLSLYERAVEPIAYLQHAITDPAQRPSLIAFPHGFQGSDWVLEPEAIAFDTLCYFIAGWQGSIAYFFPNGYDGRYWRAMAEANTLIADHEEIVFKGQRQATHDRFHMQPISPLPSIDPLAASDLDPGLLQGQEYVYGDRRLLAIGNFWQRGDVWVHMTPTNLPAEERFVVREISHERHLSSPGGNTWWTTAELRQGVDVHVGALRWAFFTIEPWYENGTYGTKLTAAEITSHLQAVQQELELIVKKEMAMTYVWADSPTPSEPYDSWENAAHDIQTAVNYADGNGTVWVTNGVYVNTTNAIIIEKNITLKSVNGPELTVIDGNFPSLTNYCLTLTSESPEKLIVDGFTIKNGGLSGVWMVRSTLVNSTVTENGFESNRGGGIRMGNENNGQPGGIVSNCVISGNITRPEGSQGGGIHMFSNIPAQPNVVRFSRIEGNISQYRGGGINTSTTMGGYSLIENCQIIGNVANNSAGGLHLTGNTTVRNSLIASNICTGTSYYWLNGSGCGGGIKMYNHGNKVENCTIVMNRASKRAGGLYGNDTQHGAGATETVENTIIDLNIAPVSPGVDAATGLLTFTNCYLQSLADVMNNTNIEANAQCLFETDTRFIDPTTGNYRLRPRSPCINAGINRSWMSDTFDLDKKPRIQNDRVDMGAYEMEVKEKITTTYVWADSPTPYEPYDAWMNAAHDIQSAVNHVDDYGTVWVTNGVYVNTTNEISIKKNITLKSVNGAKVTVIDGNFPSLTNRCLVMIGPSIVDGFTITNAGLSGVWMVRSTLLNSIVTGNGFETKLGGGIRMGNENNGQPGGIVSNCVISGNAALPEGSHGGGIHMFSNIPAQPNVVRFSRIEGNISQYRGGGIRTFTSMDGYSLIENCQIIGNVASNGSGGLQLEGGTTVRNSLIASNTCTGTSWSWVNGSGCGGGVKMYNRNNKLENCTVVMNSASKSGGGLYGNDSQFGKGATGTVENTVIDLNIAPTNSGVDTATGLLTFTNSSLQSLADVTGNTNIETNAQCLFEVNTRFANSAAGNYRLRPGSPCVNAGLNRSWMSDALDLDNQPRIQNDIVDMGAYETLLKLGTWMIIR